MTKTIVQEFQVSYRYQLYFTTGVFGLENDLFYNLLAGYNANGSIKVLFVVDDGVASLHPKLLKQIRLYCDTYKQQITYTDIMVVPGGEQSKNSAANVTNILSAINEKAICRHSFVVAIGGGAVIDMVGYAAAIAHRGVKLIRVPTTVLAQNDAAVGVKNSVNSFGKKNFLGTFVLPYAIVNDANFLDTLEQRDWIAGIAEALKVALIKDRNFFEYLEQHSKALRQRDKSAMDYTIYHCAKIHMEHIAQGGDPFESGSSRPLDFGHWAAHKLEHLTDYKLRHGEAVAKGIVLDVTYAQLIGLISEEELERIVNVFTNIGFDLSFPIKDDTEMNQLLGGIEEFREHLGGRLTITLISKIGRKHDVHSIDYNLMKKALRKINNTYNLKVV